MPAVDRFPAGFSVTAALAASRLGTSSLVFFAVAAAAPLTVVAGAVCAAYASVDFVGLPAAYLVMTVVLLVWTGGYVALSRHVVTAGALYAYVARGLGPAAGIAAGAVALVAYPLMGLGLLGGFGAASAQVLAAATGVQVPWIWCAVAAWAVTAVLGTRRIDLTGRLLGVLLAAEVAVMVVYDVVLLAHPHAGRWDIGPLWPARLADPGGLIALVGVTASFAGIELPTVLAEEARDPRRTVARATRTAVALTGGLYAVSAWALPAATGMGGIRAAASEHGSLLLFTLVTPHTPAVVVQLGQVLLVTSVFAAAVAFHTTSTRYLFALAREHVLPARLGAVNRAGAPAHASLVHSAATLTALTAYALTGADDPLRHLLLWGTVTGGFGVAVLMAATSFAATRHLTRHPAGYGLWTRRIAPTTAAVLLTAVVAFSLTQLPVLFGTTSAWTWALPGVYLGATGIGLATAAHLHLRRPHTLARIGHGAQIPTLT